MWTFGRRIALGFAIAFVLLGAIGVTAYRGITSLTDTSYAVARSHLVLHAIGDMLAALTDAETGARGYVITGEEAYRETYTRGSASTAKAIEAFRTLAAANPDQQRQLDAVERLAKVKLDVLKRYTDLRTARGFSEAAQVVQSGEGKEAMDDLRGLLGQMEATERELLDRRALEVEAAARGTRAAIVYGTLLCLLVVTGAGVGITRSLAGQIGSAVQHVQSSSAELQAAASQQATGAKEQATAMNEISTTINELLRTSRQIAESARRVAGIAGETASSAGSGDATVQRTQESVAAIRRQVDVIVSHMGDLGKKSQQIGGVLEIIDELAEKTNILAINASIEASGAGEAGKRFGVVAEEIRRLADRVGGSTKEIRKLVDDVRASVNSSVMATEGGSKAAEVGTREFADVTNTFKQIAGLVATTTEAAREIELSTKQQATAVEQVTVAIGNVAQAARETETSAGQTLQTSTQLTALSRELSRVIWRQA
jgi:CHASE3 domain sensor protein